MLKKIKKRFSKTVSVTGHQTFNEMCLNGKVYEVKKALGKGGDLNSRGVPRHQGSPGTRIWCCYGTWGQTPLMAATIGNHPEVVALLLSQPGIEVNVKCGTFGKTALHFAMEKDRDAALSLLLAAPGVDLNARDGFRRDRTLGSTPIQDAVHHGNVKAVRLMASVAEVDLDVKTPGGEGLEDLTHS